MKDQQGTKLRLSRRAPLKTGASSVQGTFLAHSFRRNRIPDPRMKSSLALGKSNPSAARMEAIDDETRFEKSWPSVGGGSGVKGLLKNGTERRQSL